MPNVVISGLTAAGKTTHAKLLADQLGYSYVSAISVILDVLQIPEDPAGIWSRNPALWDAFGDPALNRETDRRLLHLAGSRDGIVFDAWALPWLSRAPMLRIWLESDLASRERKHVVSQLMLGSSEADTRIVTLKDDASRQNFLQTYEFDLYGDRSLFDVEIDSSVLIPTTSIAAARRGIAALAPVLNDVFRAWCAGDTRRIEACAFHHARYVTSFRAK